MTIERKYERLARDLFSCGAINFGEFRLKLHEKNPDAPLSPIYVDLRILRSIPTLMPGVINAYESLTADLKFDCYADVPTAATPLVAILSYMTKIPMVSPRIDAKTHGVKGKIDGLCEAGATVLLIDDLVTTAGSKLEAIAVLEDNTLTVNDVAVLVDREQGGVQELKKHGYKCHSVFRLGELLEFYVELGLIGSDTYTRVVSYLRAQQPPG